MQSAVINTRTAVRVPTPYRAVVFAQGASDAHCVRIADVSTGGALLVGSEALPGERMRLLVLCEDPLPPIVEARVLRHFDAGEKDCEAATAVSFVRPTQPTRSAIQRVVAHELAQRVQMACARALVIERNEDVRRHIDDELRPFGARVAHAQTPLDVVRYLEAIPCDTLAIFIGRTHGSASSDELARFVMEQHPHARVVVLTGPQEAEQCRELLRDAGEAVEIVERPFAPLLLAAYLLPRRGPVQAWQTAADLSPVGTVKVPRSSGSSSHRQ